MATTNPIIRQNNNVTQATSNPQANVATVQTIQQQYNQEQVPQVINNNQLDALSIKPSTISTQSTQNVSNNNSYNVPTAVEYQEPKQQKYQSQIQNVFDNYIPQYNYEYPQIDIPTANPNTLEGQYQSRYADAMNSLLNQLLKERFSYNPNEDDLLKQATQYTTQNTMEAMNSRGILNSSLTAERVARVVGELIPTYEKMARDEFDAHFTRMANIINLLGQMDDREFAHWQDARDQKWKEEERDYQRKLDELEIAWKRVDELGYVDNDAALVLGVAAGTLSKDAREAKEAYERQIEEWNRQHEIEKQTERELLELKQQLEKDMYDYQSRLDSQKQKELYDYQASRDLEDYQKKLQMQQNSELNSYEKQLQIQQKYNTVNSNTNTTSNSKYTSRSDYEDIIKNKWATKDIDDKWIIDPNSNNAVYDYIQAENKAGRMSDDVARNLLIKYNIQDPVLVHGTAISIFIGKNGYATFDTKYGYTNDILINWAKKYGVDLTKYM